MHVFYFRGFGFLRKLSNHENYQIYGILYLIYIIIIILCATEIIDCGIPEGIESGNVQFSDTVEGSLARYECQTGYTLLGDDPVRICQDDGQWSGSVPSCNRMLINYAHIQYVLTAQFYFLLINHHLVLWITCTCIRYTVSIL